MARRDAILEGTLAAQRLHSQLGTRDAVERGEISRVDVFGVVLKLGAFLLFRRLKGLLGAYLAGSVTSTPGIMVSTERDLHVQRFTAAHELGHLVLRHELSLDDAVGLWRGESKNLREVAADAFASEFLLPSWLYLHHARRQQWQRSGLQRPETAYQLSLRLGASYDATCWGLQGHGILKPNVVEGLRQWEPRKIKAKVLGGRATLSNPWADVWVINEADNGLRVEGGPDDVLLLRLIERASAGYLWDAAGVSQEGFELLADLREDANIEECGGAISRVLVARVKEPGSYGIALSERRPWDPEDAAANLRVPCEMFGKEQGLPRVARKALMAA